jgi:hypothetical protein
VIAHVSGVPIEEAILQLAPAAVVVVALLRATRLAVMRPPKPPWRRLVPHWVYYRPGGGKGDGAAGVREPRRPRPQGGAGAIRPPRA